MLRPFNKLTCESENQGIKNIEVKITGLRAKVQLREETASCTYISQTVIIIRATFFILPQVNSMKCFKYLLTSATQVWYTSLTRPLFFIGLALKNNVCLIIGLIPFLSTNQGIGLTPDPHIALGSATSALALAVALSCTPSLASQTLYLTVKVG